METVVASMATTKSFHQFLSKNLFGIVTLLVLFRDLGTENIEESNQTIEKNGNPGEQEEIAPGPLPASHERHQRNNHDVNARKQGERFD
jgi:hypothetical protein